MIWVIILLLVIIIALSAIMVKLFCMIREAPVSRVGLATSKIDPVNQIRISQFCRGYRSYLQLSRGNETVQYNLAAHESDVVQIFTVPEKSYCLVLTLLSGFKLVRLDLPKEDEPLANIKATKLLSEDQVQMSIADNIRQTFGREPDKEDKKCIAASRKKTVARYCIHQILGVSPDGEELLVIASTPRVGFDCTCDDKGNEKEWRLRTSHDYSSYYCNLADKTLRPAPMPDPGEYPFVLMAI